jgi:hypothetical protein
LKALERTGHARGSAEEAGIDYTTAYARRRAHADFAAAWAEALKAHQAEKRRAEEEELEEFLASHPTATPPRQGKGKSRAGISRRGPSTIASSGNGPPPRAGEDLVISNGQLKRAGHGRWSKRKEKIFFDELAATANATRAAAAVGVTKNAVLQRKLRHRLFSAKWDAVVASGKAAIGLYLIEASNETFDPRNVETGVDMESITPKVTIAEAIRISEQGAKAAREAGNPFEEEAEQMDSAERDELTSILLKKLTRLKEREEKEQLSEGWTRDEENGVLVPPGWTRSPPRDASGEATPQRSG